MSCLKRESALVITDENRISSDEKNKREKITVKNRIGKTAAHLYAPVCEK